MISYIINHRGREGYRLENLLFLINYIKDITDIEIIIVEQDNISGLSTFKFPENCKYIFVKNDGLFNRSWGFNVGYKKSMGKYLIFGDNDVIINKTDLNNIINDIKNYKILNPYSEIIDTTNNEATEIKNSGKLPSIKRKGRSGINFSGGMVIFEREIFEIIGGWDEDFRGWGGEDDALSFHRIPKIVGGDKMKTLNNVAYHLWHERGVNDTKKQEHYKKNIEKLKWYKKSNKEDIIKNINLNDIGLVNKYENE